MTLRPTSMTLYTILAAEGYEILAAPNGKIALKNAKPAKPDIILLDIIMPDPDGYQVCRELKQDSATADIPVIFITIKEEKESLHKAFRVGGVDYITKPFDKEELLLRIETHLKIRRLTTELLEKNRKLEQEILRRQQAEHARNEAEDTLQIVDEQLSLISQREAEQWGVDSFVGKSQTIRQILGEIRRLHKNDTVNVLITGESGTGKELVARAIHFGGSRSKRPFIPVNCCAIPVQLAESAFFGHVQGAFTGANTERLGYFEVASGGTLFLDEIGDMPPELQAQLLRVIEDGCVSPIGGTTEKHVDVRVIAATNADLMAKMKTGSFRKDFYFRLAQFTVNVPSLHERREDIPLLTQHFIKIFAQQMGIDTPTISAESLDALMAYSFPGNVRELKNLIERAMIESGESAIQPEHLHFVCIPVSSATSDSEAPDGDLYDLPLKEARHAFEKRYLLRSLKDWLGNMTAVARRIGMDRSTLYDLLKKHKIDRRKINIDS